MGKHKPEPRIAVFRAAENLSTVRHKCRDACNLILTGCYMSCPISLREGGNRALKQERGWARIMGPGVSTPSPERPRHPQDSDPARSPVSGVSRRPRRPAHPDSRRTTERSTSSLMDSRPGIQDGRLFEVKVDARGQPRCTGTPLTVSGRPSSCSPLRSKNLQPE